MIDWYKKYILPWRLNSGMGSEELQKIRRAVISDATGVVLEIGVGPGYSIALYKDIEKLYALEPSPELLALAKTRSKGAVFPIQFLNQSAQDMPLPDSSVDTVVSTWSLCSVPDPKKVLAEIRRVLRPQGKFVFVDHGASERPFLKVLQTGCTAITKYFTGNCHYDRKIDELILGAGFSFQKMEHPHENCKPLIYNYKGVATLPGK